MASSTKPTSAYSKATAALIPAAQILYCRRIKSEYKVSCCERTTRRDREQFAKAVRPMGESLCCAEVIPNGKHSCRSTCGVSAGFLHGRQTNPGR